MNMILLIVLVGAVVLMGIGFALGWFARGGEVAKLKETHRLFDTAMKDGRTFPLSEKALMEDFIKGDGFVFAKVPMQISDAFSKKDDNDGA